MINVKKITTVKLKSGINYLQREVLCRIGVHKLRELLSLAAEVLYPDGLEERSSQADHKYKSEPRFWERVKLWKYLWRSTCGNIKRKFG